MIVGVLGTGDICEDNLSRAEGGLAQESIGTRGKESPKGSREHTVGDVGREPGEATGFGLETESRLTSSARRFSDCRVGPSRGLQNERDEDRQASLMKQNKLEWNRTYRSHLA